jgi:hypothetical protein
MRRGRRIFDLLVADAMAADGQILLLRGHGLEAAQSVYPALHRDEARAVQPRAAPMHQGGRCGGVALGVFGAILVAGEVAAMAVLESVHGLAAGKSRRHRCLQRPCPMQQFAAIRAAQPQPQPRRGGGHVHPGAGERGERVQPVDPRVQCLHGGQADTGHDLFAVDAGREVRQCGPQAGCGDEIEHQIQRQLGRLQ